MTPARAIVLAVILLYIQLGGTLWLWLFVTGTRPPLRLIVLWLPAMLGWSNWDDSNDPYSDDR